jgi:hypothetical protein
MSSVPSWAAGSVIAAVLLLSPVFAFLMVIAAEGLIDLLMEAPALLALVAAGVIGWSLRRKRWPRPDRPRQSELCRRWKNQRPLQLRRGDAARDQRTLSRTTFPEAMVRGAGLPQPALAGCLLVAAG